MLDVNEGKGPIYMRTEEAIQNIAAKYKDDEKAFKKKMKELEAEAWEDFLDMTISQAILWAASDIQPEEKSSEIAAAEPYFIGSHSGGSGAWVSGPEDIAPAEYFWGYTNMSTVTGMFCVGDASGASSHKFSSGSLTEGRIAGKEAVRYCVDNPAQPAIDDAKVAELKATILKPLDVFEANKGLTTDPNINPNYIRPKMFMFRLQKLMDEYAAGVTAQFATNEKQLERALELLALLREDSVNLAAADLHELMRCWENVQRMWQAEVHVRTMLFRKETRWPGYYFRSDYPKLNQDEWKCFVNAKWDPASGEWEMSKKPVIELT
jgi:adenylylsulfate reductase subunit A